MQVPRAISDCSSHDSVMVCGTREAYGRFLVAFQQVVCGCTQGVILSSFLHVLSYRIIRFVLRSRRIYARRKSFSDVIILFHPRQAHDFLHPRCSWPRKRTRYGRSLLENHHACHGSIVSSMHLVKRNSHAYPSEHLEKGRVLSVWISIAKSTEERQRKGSERKATWSRFEKISTRS